VAEPRIAPAQALLTARIVAIALLVSGATIAVVGTIVTLPSADAQPDREGATMFFAMWVASAVGAMIGWGHFWRRATGFASAPGARREIESGRLHAGMVIQGLVAAYALLEVQLMVALVASILGRTPMLLVPSLTLFAIGILLSFPRREWFAPFEHASNRLP
jgi:hypothetical protein